MSSRIAVVACVLFAVLGGFAPARAACDQAPPELTDFAFNPTSINTTAQPQVVVCTMSVTDDLTGVSRATCMFQSPSFQQVRSCTATHPASGGPSNGTFSCAITFPRYSEAGTWSALVTLEDGVGNSQTAFPQFLGFPFAVSVTSDPDTLPPAVNPFTFGPLAVNVSASGRTVTCTMTVTDAKSGVEFALCGFDAPDSDQSRGCAANTPSSGTVNNGTFTCSFSMPQYSDAGNWTASAFVRDFAGNFTSSASAQSLAVTANPEDIAGPALTGFSFTPTSVSVGEAARSVLCTMVVTDNVSGVGAAQCTFSYTDPFNPFVSQSAGCTATLPASGTRTDGTFQCGLTIPRSSAGGLWDADVELTDQVGNSTSVLPPEQLTVDCSLGEAETTCRFANKTTLSWDPVPNASRYNVYRGEVVGLNDANQDQEPDGGYGTCQNSRDSNLTDTSFTDTDVPSTAQQGFHYLVSYTDSDVEMGLGFSTFGNPRTVVAPCP